MLESAKITVDSCRSNFGAKRDKLPI